MSNARPAFAFIGIILWLAANAGDGYWMYNYYKRPFTTPRLTGVDRPLHKQVSGILALGFFWGFFNIIISCILFCVSWEWWRQRKLKYADHLRNSSAQGIHSRRSLISIFFGSVTGLFSNLRRHKHQETKTVGDSESYTGSEKSFLSSEKGVPYSGKSVPYSKKPVPYAAPMPKEDVGGRIVSSTTFGLAWWLLWLFVIIPIFVALAAGPFIAPFVLRSFKWKHAYVHRCDDYPIEVETTSRMNMAASLYYWKDNVRTKYSEYRTMSTSSILNFTYHYPMPMMGSRQPPPPPVSSLPADIQPVVYQIQYYFSNNTMSATCFQPGSTDNTTVVNCMQGSFDPDNFFSFSITDTRTNTRSSLRATEKDWFTARNEPTFTLKDVQSRGELGNIALEAVSRGTRCSNVKFCLARKNTLDMLAPLGLAVAKHADNDMVSCVRTNSGGLD